MNKNNIKKVLLWIVSTAMIIPSFASSAILKTGEDVSIKQTDPIEENVYTAGGNVFINSKIFGDLYTVGGNVLISEDISEDIVAVGGSVTFLGDSGGDVRVVGGNVLITGNVVGDLVVAGGSVTVSSGVVIGKDLIVAGGQVVVDGDVDGDVKMAGGVATINGHVKGEIIAKIDERLRVGDGAVVDGGLVYRARTSEVLSLSDSAVVTGETVFEERKFKGHDKKKGLFATFAGFITLKLIALIITALALVYLFKDFSNSVVSSVRQNIFKNLGKGFIALIVAPVLIIILFITLFGIPIGMLAFLSYILLIFISGIYSGVVVGSWASSAIHKTDGLTITWKNIVVGFVLLAILHFIPIFGWVVVMCIYLATVGSIMDAIHRKLFKS